MRLVWPQVSGPWDRVPVRIQTGVDLVQGTREETVRAGARRLDGAPSEQENG